MKNPAVLFSPAFGALMVAAAARPGSVWALAALGLAAAAVLAGVFDRRAAVAAVVLTVVGITLSDVGPLFAAVSGLSAAAYLLARYSAEAVTLTTPTLLGMCGFAVAGAAVTALPVRLTWVPLVAPAIMAAILIAAVAPLVAPLVSPLVSRSVARPGVTPDPPG
jgi:hypothetical protein